jgi:phage terminase small subunit
MGKRRTKKKKKSNQRLNYQQKKFADCYEGNGPDAARKAGYKGSNATLRVTASRLLTNDNVLEAIVKRQKKEESSRNATRQEKLELLTELIRDNIAVLVETKDGKKRIELKVKPGDRIKAIEVHSKISGDLIIKKDHTHRVGKSFKDGLDQVKKHFESHPDKEKMLLKELEKLDEEE